MRREHLRFNKKDKNLNKYETILFILVQMLGSFVVGSVFNMNGVSVKNRSNEKGLLYHKESQCIQAVLITYASAEFFSIT